MFLLFCLFMCYYISFIFSFRNIYSIAYIYSRKFLGDCMYVKVVWALISSFYFGDMTSLDME